MNRVLILVSFH